MINITDNSAIINYLGNNLEVHSVSSFRLKFSNLIKDNFKNPIIIKAVVSSVPKVYPEYVFFEIRDEQKNLYITVMSNIYTYRKAQNKLKTLNLVDGLLIDTPVMLVVEPKVSTQKKVELRLSLLDIIPEYTSSILKNKLEETINKLKLEGLFDLQKKLSFPLLPRNIVILSSDQGTSFKDIVASLGKSKRYFNLIFISIRVEGAEAINNIESVINYLNKINNIDLILLARGGGSLQDLSVFNEYRVCHAICTSRIPIICAIGHETDTLASEIVAYYSPKPSTPSGIGAYINNYFSKLIDDFNNLNSTINYLLNQNFLKEYFTIKDKINLCTSSIKNQYYNKINSLKNICLNISNYLKINRKIFFKFNLDKINNLLNNFIFYLKKEFKVIEDKLVNLIKIVEANNHKTILSKGYTFVKSIDGKTIKKLKEVEKNMNLNFIDGSIKIQYLEDNYNGKTKF